MLRELARTSRGKDRREFEHLAAQTEPLLVYMARESEVAAASEALEAHRAEFEALVDDPRAFAAQAHRLFGEEPFRPLRFTVHDVRRAFDHVGPPPSLAGDDRFVEIVRAAILHLADKDCRHRLSLSLLAALPDYVAAGRPLDAWILQDCAYRTSDDPEQSNAFLFEMFSYGYNAWAEEQRAADASVLRELGIDLHRLEGMTMEEIDAWFQQQEADPRKKSRLEAVLQMHPAQEALAIANFEEMQRNSAMFLRRADAAHLLLSTEETAQWVPRMNECFEGVRDQLPGLTDAKPDEAASKILMDAIQPVLSEMAGAVFTLERRRQLLDQLRTYRNERFAQGEKDIAAFAQGALSSLEHEDDPALNYFLVSLCFVSIRRLVDTLADPEASEPELPSAEQSKD